MASLPPEHQLDRAKIAFRAQLDWIQSHPVTFAPCDARRFDWIRAQLQTPLCSLQTLGRLAMLPIENRDLGMQLLNNNYNVIATHHLSFHHDQGTFAWCHLKALSSCGQFALHLTILRIALCCAGVQQQQNLCENDTAVYCTWGFACSPPPPPPSSSTDPWIIQWDPEFCFANMERIDGSRFIWETVGTVPARAVRIQHTTLGQFLVHTNDQTWLLENSHQWSDVPNYIGFHDAKPSRDQTGTLRCGFTNLQWVAHTWKSTASSSSSTTTTRMMKGAGWFMHQWKREGPSPKGYLRFWHQISKQLPQVWRETPWSSSHTAGLPMIHFYIQLYKGPQYVFHTFDITPPVVIQFWSRFWHAHFPVYRHHDEHTLELQPAAAATGTMHWKISRSDESILPVGLELDFSNNLRTLLLPSDSRLQVAHGFVLSPADTSTAAALDTTSRRIGWVWMEQTRSDSSSSPRRQLEWSRRVEWLKEYMHSHAATPSEISDTRKLWTEEADNCNAFYLATFIVLLVFISVFIICYILLALF